MSPSLSNMPQYHAIAIDDRKKCRLSWGFHGKACGIDEDREPPETYRWAVVSPPYLEVEHPHIHDKENGATR
jgi:hypothetical protein